MTLPASGAITLGDVATELGQSKPLTLGHAAVRALAGVPSGAISLGQLRGKSAFSASLAQQHSSNTSGSPGNRRVNHTVTVTCTAPGATNFAWTREDNTYPAGAVTFFEGGNIMQVYWSTPFDQVDPNPDETAGGSVVVHCTASKTGASANDTLTVYI